MKQVKIAIITGYGINADRELGRAFDLAGGSSEPVHVQDLIREPGRLLGYDIAAFPGGFSFGDHLGSGKVLSHLVKKGLGDTLARFMSDEKKLAIGICNGFQTIAKMGLVPNLAGDFRQEASLLNNIGGSFIDRWVTLRVNPANTSPWLRGIRSMRVPIRHGEGRFIMKDQAVEDAVVRLNLPAFYYEGENPNGAALGIAGISDTSGRIIGMMPHPEAALWASQDPDAAGSGSEPTDASRLFLNAVSWCQERA